MNKILLFAVLCFLVSACGSSSQDTDLPEVSFVEVDSRSGCPLGIYTYQAAVTDVYDGDTITVNIDLGFHTWIHGEKLRLSRIDAPEVRGSERPEGIVSRDWLRDKILGENIYIRTIKDRKGKYGRYIAELFSVKDGICQNLNDLLVSNGLAEYREY